MGRLRRVEKLGTAGNKNRCQQSSEVSAANVLFELFDSLLLLFKH